MSIAVYLIVMALSTYLVRVLPFTIFRKKIKSKFIKSFLYYVPYAVLSAMTFPAVFYSTGSIATAVIGTLVALILSYFSCSLIVVALSAALAAFLSGMVL